MTKFTPYKIRRARANRFFALTLIISLHREQTKLTLFIPYTDAAKYKTNIVTHIAQPDKQ